MYEDTITTNASLDTNCRPTLATCIAKNDLLTFKATNNIAPLYITELLEHYVPSRSLHSSSKNLLKVPKHI